MGYAKRPETPEPLDPEELEDNEDQGPQPTPEASPSPTPKPETQKPAEDVQLKKALEVLRGENAAAKAA
jgi:hypothetical protein